MAEVIELKERIKELESEIMSLKKEYKRREIIKQMSAEVVDSNPYRYWTFELRDLIIIYFCY